MSDVVELSVPPIQGLDAVISSLDFLEARIAKLSRTGTRNTTNLNKSITSGMSELARATREGLNEVIFAMGQISDASAKNSEMIRRDMNAASVAMRAAKQEQLRIAREAKEAMVALDKRQAAESAATLAKRLEQEKAVQLAMEAGWAKTLAAKNATAAAELLYTKEHNDNIIREQLARVVKEKALLGTASRYTPGVVGGSLMSTTEVSALNRELAKTPWHLDAISNGSKSVSDHMEMTGGKATSLSGRFKQLALDGNNLHSMARGLASGFGLLWLTWGNMVPLLAGAAISMSFVKAMKSGAEFAESLAVIQNLAGATGESISAMTKQVFDLGASTPYGPTALANALKVLSLAGLDAQDAMLALRPTMDFALAGGVTAEKAAETLVAVSTAYGYSAAQVSVVGDIIAKTAAISMTSVDKMSESFKVASTVAQQFGVTLNDSALQLAFLSQIGITGTAAGTAMTNYYTNIVMGTKASNKALKDLGVTVMDSFGKVKEAGKLTGELVAALAKFDVPTQNKLLGDLTTNRGLRAFGANYAAFTKVIVELNPVQAAHIKLLEGQGKAAEAAAEKAALATTQFKKFQEQIQDAPGFTAIAAAGMNLTPENQMKGIKASLEADLIKSFMAVNDQLFITGQKLREVFNSTEFQAAITAMVQGVVWFIDKLVDVTSWLGRFLPNLLAVTGALWDASKILAGAAVAAGGIILAVEALTGSSLLLAPAIGLVGVAFTSLRVALAAHPILLIGSLILAGVAAYTALTGKTKEHTEVEKENGKVLAEANRLRNQSFLESIDASIQAKKAAIEAARTGKSIEQTQAELALSNHLTRLTQIRAQELAEINLGRVRQAVALAEDPNNEDAKRAVRELDKLRLEANSRYLEGISKAVLKVDELKRLSKQLAELLVTPKPAGTLVAPPKDTSHFAAFKVEQDQETEILVNSLANQGKLIDNAYTNELARLNSQLSNKLISEGAYANQSYTLAKNYEDKKLAFLDDAEVQRTAAYATDVNRAVEQYTTADTLAKKYFTDAAKYTAYNEAALKSLRQKLDEYNGTYSKWSAGNTTEKEKARENAFTVMTKGLNKLLGALHDTQKAYDEFNIAEQQRLDKVNRQTALEDQMRYASPEARAWLTATSAEEELLISQIDKLEKSLRDASQAASDFEATGGVLGAEGIAALAKRAELAKELADIKAGVSDKVAKAGARADLESAKKNVATMAGGLAASVETALKEGGAKGAEQLRRLIQEELLFKPFTIMLTGVLGSVLTGLGQAAGQSLGAAGLTSAAGTGLTGGLMSAGASYVGSSLGLTGAGSFASGWSGAAAAAGSADIVTGGIYTASTAMEGIGASLYSTLSAVPVAGWIALAALAAYAVFSEKVTPKLEGGYAPNGMSISGLDGLGNQQGSQRGDVAGAQTISNSISTAYANIAKQLGIKDGKVDVGVFYAKDPTGNSETQLQVIGGSYNRSNVMGGIENAGKTDQELQSAIALATSQLVLTNLQSSTLPKSLQGIFDSLDVAKMDQSAIDTILATAQSFADLHTQLLALPFESLKDLSYAAAQALVTAAGGMQTLGTNLGSFYQNFYSDAERTANLTTNTSAAFAALGLTMPELDLGARSAYRALVEEASARDLSVTANAEYYAGLLALNDAVNTLAPSVRSASDILSEHNRLQEEYDTLAMSSADLLTKQRNALDGSNQSLFDMVQTAKTAKTAADELAQSLKDAADEAKALAEAATTSLASLRDRYADSLTTQTAAEKIAKTLGANVADILSMDSNGMRLFIRNLASGIDPATVAGREFLHTLEGLNPAFDTLISGSDSASSAVLSFTESVRGLVEGIHNSVVDSVFNMNYGLADNAGKYSMLDSEAARYDKLMRSSGDIDMIAAYAQKEIDTANKAFALLDPAQQTASLDRYTLLLEKVDTFVTGKGADAVSLKAADNKALSEAVSKAVKEALAELAQEMTDAAIAQADSASKIASVIREPANVRVTVSAPRGSEVSVA